jgi:hypothetical protein
MATMRAGWKRTVQTKPYESETLELAVELDVDASKMSRKDLLDGLAGLERDIAAQGDILLVERLAARQTPDGVQPALDRLAGSGGAGHRVVDARRLVDAVADTKRVTVTRPGSGTRLDKGGMPAVEEPDDFVK